MYEEHLDDALKTGKTDEKFADATRKMVILRSNEALLIRKYKAIEGSEKILRKENVHLKEDVVKIENKFTETIGSLQRQKEMTRFKMESLHQVLSLFFKYLFRHAKVKSMVNFYIFKP